MATPFSVSEQEMMEIVDGYEIALLGSNDLMSIGHMHFEPGTSIPEHSHANQQIGFIYRGELTFHADGDRYVLGPGDGYTLEGNEPHYGENLGDEPIDGIYIHSPPREPPNWDE